MTGLRTLLALELQSLWARRLWRWGMVGVTAIAAIGAWLAGTPDPTTASVVHSGWHSLIGGAGPAVLFAGVVALLLGSQLIAAEAGEGSLRSTLLRPVDRTALLSAKIAALFAGVSGLALAALAGAGLVAAAQWGFGDVTVEIMGAQMVKQHAGTMAVRGLWLALIVPLALMTAGAIGLTLSAWSESSGASATGAMFIGVPLTMASTLTFGWTEWLFPRPCLKVWDAYSILAGGYDTAAWHTAPVAWSLTCSVGWLVIALVGATLVFQRRDVLS